MNHRLKDKAAMLRATSLQGDKNRGVRGRAAPSLVPNGCPRTPFSGAGLGSRGLKEPANSSQLPQATSLGKTQSIRTSARFCQNPCRL